jgi:phosphate transport system substrate-binding protein
VRKRTLAAALLFAATIFSACGSSKNNSPSAVASGGGEDVALSGAGATFPGPLYLDWISKYKGVKSNVSINYQAIGSGGGITQFTNQAVDFGASDAAMKDEEIEAATAKRRCGVLHIPTVFGAVTVAYNAGSSLKELTLDGPTVADIFLGKIKKYDDPAIKALNPGATLPSQDIRVVHRSDSSGTTKIFTSYLAEVSPTWKSRVGADKTVKWPTGAGGNGNDGVASAIQNNPGGFGYIELSYALSKNMTTAKLKNKDGKAIAPSLASTSAALGSFTIPADLRFTVSGVGGDGYPIVGATWILAYECGYEDAKAAALKDFLTWALNNGAADAKELGYATLDAELKTKSLQNVEKINSK